MTEIRGEVVHICARIILKYEKVKKVKDNYQAVQSDKNE